MFPTESEGDSERMNYYPHHIGDYAKDTRALTQGEHGAYRLLMDEAYSTETGIAADEVYAITCAKSAQEKRNADRVLAKFFVLEGGRYRQKRIDLEVRSYQEKSAKASASAQKRWSERNANACANAIRTHTEGSKEADANTMLPITNNQEPKKNLPTTSGDPPSQPDPIFGPCLEFLRSKDVGDKGARSMLGAWRRDYGDQAVCEAVAAAEREDVTMPIPWIKKVLEANKKPKFAPVSQIPRER